MSDNPGRCTYNVVKVPVHVYTDGSENADEVIEYIKRLNVIFTSVITTVKEKLVNLVMNNIIELWEIAQCVQEIYQLSHLPCVIKNVDELFNNIQPHYCFLNCNLIKRMLQKLFSDQDKVHSMLSSYENYFERAQNSIRLNDIERAIEKSVLANQQNVTATTCKVYIKLNKKWRKSLFINFWSTVHYIFDSKRTFLNQILCISEDDFICVSFIAPISQSQALIKLAISKKQFMKRVGIAEVSINEQIIISQQENMKLSLEQSLLEAARTGDHISMSILVKLGVNTDCTALLDTRCQRYDKDGRTCLHIAVLHNDIGTVSHLVKEYGCDPMCRDYSKMTPLHYAGKQGCLHITKYLIAECKCNSLVINSSGSTCLHFAVLSKNIDLIKYLISECGCDPKHENNNKWTPLHCASKQGCLNIMRYLVEEHNCNPMAADKDGRTCLHIAVLNNHINVVKYLISKCGCDPVCKDNRKMTPLHYSGQAGHLSIMKYLISICSCDPMVTNSNGRTCLHYAVLNNHVDIVKYLISKCNCDPLWKNNNGWTPLHDAGRCGNLDVIKYLVCDCKCDPMVANRNGRTCLHIAVLNNHLDVVKYLIADCHCDPNVRDNDGDTCFQLAVISNDIDVVKYLFTECSCVLEHSNLLHYSVEDGTSLNILEYLITQCSFDPLARDKNGRSCLHTAALSKRIDVLKYLITNLSYDPLFKDIHGMTPLQYAGRSGSLNIMKYLIFDCCCDPMVRDKYGKTCLHIAVLNNRISAVKYLINECRCDPMFPDEYGRTSLHMASIKNHISILKFLVDELGCNPNVPNTYGRTCLHLAVMYKCYQVIEYLLSTGQVDPLSRDCNNQTPFQLTKRDKVLHTLFTKFGKIKMTHPVDSYVNVLLLGNSGAGKTTLAKVITERANSKVRFHWFKCVESVEPYTAGIIPTKLHQRKLGNVVLHDFAGQSEYYTSHAAVIENLLKGSAAVFIIVINILEEEASLHLHKWLTIVTNEVHKTLTQCHMIVVASHVDELTDSETEVKTMQLQDIISKRCNSYVTLESLDCRKLGGSRITALLNNLSSACQSIRNTSGKNLSLYCHMMYCLLEESEQSILSLSDVITAAVINQEYFLPKNKEEILHILYSLDSTGLISLVKNTDGIISKVWIVFNKQILLAEVNGILFAPKKFKQHHNLASNTGVITFSALAKLFPHYDPEMLVCFLKNMALCLEINPQFLSLTRTNLLDTQDNNEERFLFFPTLLSVNRPDKINQQVFKFGWCLQCTEDHHFFPSHFLHVLLFNLAFTFVHPKYCSEPPIISRQCTFWKNGIHWFDGDGVGTLVELVNESRCLVVMMSCEQLYEKNMVFVRKFVIEKITNIQKECCPRLKLLSFVIDPQELLYPIDKPTQRTVYSLQSILFSIINKKEFVISSNEISHKHIEQLIPNETVQAGEGIFQLSILGGHHAKELISCIMMNSDIKLNLPPHDNEPQNPQLMIEELNITYLDVVMEHLQFNHFASHHWKELGLHLGLYQSTLDDINDKCRGDPRKCLQECLSAWLNKQDKVINKGGPSWTSLATALHILGHS